MTTFNFREWEPNRCVVLDWRSSPQGDEPRDLPVEFRLEEKDSGTILKLIQSGFLSDESWDEEFESHQRGWNI